MNNIITLNIPVWVVFVFAGLSLVLGALRTCVAYLNWKIKKLELLK